MKRLLCLSLCLTLLAAGCGSPSPSVEGFPVEVYFVAPLDAGAPILRAETVYCLSEDGRAAFALDCLMRTPQTADLRSPFPAETEVLSLAVQDSVAYVDLSAPFGTLTGLSLTLAEACLTLTLTAIPGIDGVTARREGEDTAPGRDTRVMRAYDFMTDSLTIASTDRLLTLYFSDDEGRYALAETRPLLLRENESLEWYLTEELIAGPKGEGLRPVMPEGTVLLSVTVRNSVCTVDLSGEFIPQNPDIRAARMTLTCLVGSLTGLPAISSVRLLVDGRPTDSYCGLDTSSPLKRDSFLTGRTDAPGMDVLLFYPDRAGLGLVPVAVWLPTRPGISAERSALELLCELSAPAGLLQALPSTPHVLSLSKRGYQYTLDLSASFTRESPPSDPRLTLQALAHTLAQFTPGAAVTLLIEGQPLERYFSIEITGPVEADPDALLP